VHFRDTSEYPDLGSCCTHLINGNQSDPYV
jgi:hypothetical protein